MNPSKNVQTFFLSFTVVAIAGQCSVISEVTFNFKYSRTSLIRPLVVSPKSALLNDVV